MKIAVCGSMSTQQGVDDIFNAGKSLEILGHEIFYPVTEDLSDYKNMSPEEVEKSKNFYMWEHIKKIEQADAVLVTNSTKKGISGYVGANTFLEMAIAMYLNKKIFLMNPVVPELGCYEEVLGMKPIVLNGDLSLVL